MRRLWLRYQRARGAKIGLALVVVFTLVAFLAPFIAHRLPLYWHDPATGLTSWPLIREFFAPSDTTEPMLEKGINFLFLFIPLALITWALLNKFAPRLGRMDSRAISVLFGLIFSAAVWLSLGGMVVAGGGDDWFHYENPPVPEMDDIVNPAAAARQPDNPRQTEARALVDASLPNLASLVEEPGDDDTLRRRILPSIQSAIDGPAIAPVSAMLSADANFDTMGITDQNLDLGINAPRWNRMLIETAYPGLLAPMRNARITFLTLAFVCLLVLIGLTYIFLAGAYQFSLSPRWLVLLALALVVSLPFGATPRHDHTPYRQLAAEGNGTGVFPLIPYGPNEQGFGPRLPPDWIMESPAFSQSSIASWDNFIRAMDTAERPESTHIRDMLAAALPDWREKTQSETGRQQIIAELNAMLTDPALLVPEELDRMRGDIALGPYLAEIRAGRVLAPPHLERFNRLILERAIPYTFHPVAAVRWKKPAHQAGKHWLGTDESGRDVLVRIIHGARVSLSVGFVSVFLATVIGLVMGSLAAYYGGKVDMLISRFLEIMMCFPSFFLILAVIAVLDKRSIINIMLVIGLTSWTGVARLIRGEMLRQKKMDYVWASIALGASDTRTIFRHILPNAMAPVLVSISFGITGAILTEAGLSFIGFGVTPPTPTWGQLLSETRESPLANWWLAVFPGLVLFFSVIAYNMMGEALRDALDPRTSL